MDGTRLGLCLAVLSTMIVPGLAFADEADEAYSAGVEKAEQARRLQDDGRLESSVEPLMLAVKHVDRVIQLRPHDARGYAWRGRVLRLEYEKDRALSDLDQAIRLDPRLVMAYQERGGVYSDLNRFDEAMRDFAEAIRLDPNGADSYIGRAETLAVAHKSKEALADYTTAIRLRPSDAKAHTGMFLLQMELGDTEAALAGIDEAIRLSPEDIKFRVARALLLICLKKKPDQAIEDLDKVLDRKPDAECFAMRGILLAGLDRNERAIQDFSEAIRSGHHPKLLGARGTAYYNLGQYDRAVRDFDEAIKLDAKSAGLYAVRCAVREKLRDIDGAIGDCDEAIRLDPRVVGTREIRATLAMTVEDYDRAVREFDEALRLDAGRGMSLYFRDLLFVALDRDAPIGSARPYLGRKGWRDAAAPSVVLAGYFTERRAKHPGEARSLLDDALRRCDAKEWPMPIIRHFHGDESEETLLKTAGAPAGQADVHFYLGIDRLLSGDNAAATGHLKKSRGAGGDGRFVGLARLVLRRVEEPETK